MTHPDAQRAFEEMMPEPFGYIGLTPVYTVPQMRQMFEAATERAAKEEREKCADVAARWSNSSRLLLSIGEATAQELRSCKAVARGIAAAIRSSGRGEG